jgi:hypothetical protein
MFNLPVQARHCSDDRQQGAELRALAREAPLQRDA